MSKNCRNCHFLVVQCRPVLGIGTGIETEPWWFAYHNQTGRLQFVQRSWDAEERSSGKALKASKIEHMATCFKGVWRSGNESVEKKQLDQRRRGCYWTPFQTGRDLDSAAAHEARNREDSAHAKSRRIPLWALIVAVLTLIASVFFGFWQRRAEPLIEGSEIGEQVPTQTE